MRLRPIPRKKKSSLLILPMRKLYVSAQFAYARTNLCHDLAKAKKTDGKMFFFAGKCLVLFWFLLGVCGCCLVLFSSSVERHHTALALQYRKLTTVSASLAVIRTASKHLHNDLAEAIEALEQKKVWFCFGSFFVFVLLLFCVFGL